MRRLSELPLGLYEKAMCFSLTWEEKMRLAAQSGYDYLEINIDGTPERLKRLESEECAWELYDASRKTGIPVYTFAFTANRMFPLGSEDDDKRNRGIELLKKAIVFAGRAGIRVIHIAAYDELDGQDNENTKWLFQKSVRECVAYAAHFGVILAFETMDTEFMDSVAKVMEYVRMIGSPYLQVYADVANITAAGYDPAIDMAAGGRHIVGMHLKDSKEKAIRDIAFGTGDVDFDACFRALSQMNYQGFFTAEMWCYDDPQFHSYLKEANVFLREKLAKY